MQNIQDLVNKTYEDLFSGLCELDEIGDCYEIRVEVQLASEGTTIKRSWRERNDMLRKENK